MGWIGVITNNGNEMLTRWVEGKTLTVTRAAAGQGRVEQTAMLAQSGLVNEKQSASILSNTPVEKGQRLKLQVTAQTGAGYSLNQFGVWAMLEDEDEKMIALFQTDTDIGVEIPSKDVMPDFAYTFYGLLAFSNQGTLTVNIDAAAVVTEETMEQAIAGAMEEHNGDENAHKALFDRKADLSESGKMGVDQLPVNEAGGVAGLDGDGKVPLEQLPVGTPYGLAELDEAGKVLSSQLPSYVDDVVEGYYHEGKFYSDQAYQQKITPESGKIYVDAESNITYRWSGSAYVAIGSDLALGETASTAYRGDRGKEAYDHSQIKSGNPHGTKAYDIDYTDNKGLGSTNLQGAMDAAAQKAIDAQKSADAALEAITKIAHTIDAVPSQNGTLTYTGQQQSPSWNGYNPETMELGGVTTGTDAGTYYATFTPKEGYTWGDETTDAKSVAWSIGKATIATVPSQSGSLTYTGSSQSPKWANYDEDKLTLGGTTSGTDAGSYNATFTPKVNYQWQDGGTGEKTAEWAIGRATIAAVPSQSGTVTYTGSAQSPTWANYDSAKLTIGGTTSGTNAGNYTASFTPKENYQWSDGGTGAKNAAWTIQKAAGSLTISPGSMTLEDKAQSKTITATRAGTGAITASASPSGIVTVSVSGNIVTVKPVKNGSATVTVNVAADANYNAPSAKTCSVTVSLPSIYGVEWDGTSTTVWSRTDDAAGFANPTPYRAGASSYGSPFDNLMPWSGMTRVSDSEAGELVKIPKFWFKWTKNGNRLKLQIADKATEGFYVSPAHANRGDGKGERDVVYVGRYHCHTSNYKSQTGGKPKANITRSAARNGIHALGSTIWQSDIQMRMTLWMLYLVEFADWNSQKTIGKGCGNSSATENMGYTDSMPYHTGTTQSSRDTYGLGTQYRNIEGLWDNVYDWGDGCYYNSAGLNIIMTPASFSDNSGGTAVGVPSSGWPSAFAVSDKNGLEWCIYPTATGGSENTYSSDYWYFSASGPCLYFGGNYSQGGDHGLFYVGYYAASVSVANIGCRLQKLP